MKEWLLANSEWFTPLASFLGPLIGFFLVAVALLVGFGRLGSFQKEQLRLQQRNEGNLKKREKAVLAASMAGELTENKIKCEAFITIYNELLRNLRDTKQPAHYEETGDYIHQRPSLSRAIFDANVDRISIFGPKLAGEIAATYAGIKQESEYWNLEKNMPRSTAIRMVEMVLEDAQKTMEPLDSVISGLNIIVRDSQ